MALNPNGKAVTTKATFSRETSVSISIDAATTVVWALLTNAADYPRWNSTIVSLEGTIAQGQQIRLVSTLDPKRTFKLTVKEMEANKRLVWGDAMGKRVFTLETSASGVVFSMTEKIGGPLFPLFARMIPPFDASFEQFASDLKKAAEA
ncbi:MAG: SRPBCC domain-containing protein [Candidatus Kapabacteria bacterium]|jgi:uncharacterized protein YndB with AHSA1/START domain|nr:SRPBCC domain-containing protein [Candidatus Kapabacteria bacterium]